MKNNSERTCPPSSFLQINKPTSSNSKPLAYIGYKQVNTPIVALIFQFTYKLGQPVSRKKKQVYMGHEITGTPTGAGIFSLALHPSQNITTFKLQNFSTNHKLLPFKFSIYLFFFLNRSQYSPFNFSNFLNTCIQSQLLIFWDGDSI